MCRRALAQQLIKLAAEAEPIDIAVGEAPITQSEVKELFDEYGVKKSLVDSAEELVKILERKLASDGRNPDVSVCDQSNEGRWAFGTAMTLKGRRLDIHGGFLDPVLSIPILERVPDLVVRFLLTIEDGEDYLKCEAHSGVGWHYHYLNRNKQRSDVILCWDTRWVAPSPQSTPSKLRGLFAEKHAEAGKPFSARPGAWGKRKRESMYSACETDLCSRDIKEYRCAANKSELVYPPEAALTPHPSNTVTVKVANKKGGKSKKRGR